jgi:hypothetical protein
MTPTVGTVTMAPPVGARVSMRATKGQTNRYDDFVQQINLKPGTYTSDATNLYMLEDIGNTSSMRYMLTAFPTWQQKINQNWSPDTAHVQQLSCDSHQQTCQQCNMMNVNMMTGIIMTNSTMNMMNANMMTSNMMNGNTVTGNMMNGNMMTSNMVAGNMVSNNSGHITNEGYSCYQDTSP